MTAAQCSERIGAHENGPNTRLAGNFGPRLGEDRLAAGFIFVRLLGVLIARLEVTKAYHRFSALLFRQAADPSSPLNPFHPAGADIRRDATEVFARVLDGANVKVPKDLAAELPELLWTYSMGIVLFWIHDDSDDCVRTRKLAEHTADIVVKCIKLASNPLLRPVRRRVLDLLRDLRVE